MSVFLLCNLIIELISTSNIPYKWPTALNNKHNLYNNHNLFNYKTFKNLLLTVLSFCNFFMYFKCCCFFCFVFFFLVCFLILRRYSFHKQFLLSFQSGNIFKKLKVRDFKICGKRFVLKRYMDTCRINQQVHLRS